MKKILVVDNNKLILEFMTDLLEKEGHQVLTAEDGLSALEILKTYIPDVIFIDLIMPNIDGKKLCQIIQGMPELKETYRVILSAVAVEEEEEINFAELGADAYIAKGKFNEMEQHIHAVLDQSERKLSKSLSGEKIIGLGTIYPREITKELLSTNRHFETILEGMSEGILEVTSEKKVVYVNPAALFLIGMPEENLLGTKFIKLFNEADQERIEELLQDKMAAEAQIITEEAPLNINGKKVSLNIIPLKGGKEGSIIIFNDITKRKRAEEFVEKTAEEQALLLDNIKIQIWYLKDVETYGAANIAHTDFLGREKKDIENKSLYDFLSKDQADTCVNTNREVFDKKEQLQTEEWSVNYEGELRLLSITKTPKLDAGKNVEFVVCSAEDITERKKIETALKESEVRYRGIFSSAQDGILIFDLEGNIAEANPQACKMYGYPYEELITLSGKEIIHPDCQNIFEQFQSNTKERGTFQAESIDMRKDGSQFNIEVTGTDFNYKGEKHLLAVVRDITERKRAEESLANSEKKLSQIVQGSPIPTFVIDKKHTIKQWNTACESLTGLKEDEMIGTKKQWIAFYSTERRLIADLIVDNATEEEIEKYYQGKYRKSPIIEGGYEVEDFFPDLGERGKWLFFTVSPLRNVDGKINGAIEALQDITERKQAEKKLKKAKEAIDAANLKLEEANRELERLTLVDGLTDIANRRHFNQAIADEWRRAFRSKNILSLVMVDIDYFKNYNDHYGHQAGDDCLRKVAKMLNKVAKRPGDLVTRYGGEEFAIILSDTDSKSASSLAEETRKDVLSLKIPHGQSDICEYVTISLGVASTVPARPDLSYQTLIEAADNCLYQAKNKGRNQVQASNGTKK